jgi:hypothetical protein
MEEIGRLPAQKSLSRMAMADFSRLRQRLFLAPRLHSDPALKTLRRRRATEPSVALSMPGIL